MKNIKMLIVGFVAGAIFATASGAYAAVGDKVEAVFADFNFIVNGKSVTLDETPLVYNGTSYLPVRSLSNAVGMDVTYKADSRTIELTKSDTVTGSTYGTGSTSGSVTTPTSNPVATPSPSSGSVGLDTTTTVGGNTMGAITETKFNGVSAIIVDGVTYFNLNEYVATHRDVSGDWEWNNSVKEWLHISKNEHIGGSDLINYSGYSFVNVKYFPSN